MSLLHDMVKKLEERTMHSGCEDGVVVLRPEHDPPACPYPAGTRLVASFGGRSGEIVTDSVVTVTTKVSYMFGAPLETPVQRAAACAIINAVCAFFCFTRISGACPPEAHTSCLSSLKQDLDGCSVFLIGTMPALMQELSGQIADSPASADILLVGGDGLTSDEGVEMIDEYHGRKRMIFLGPSASGITTLLNLEHWCPFGR